MGDGGVGPWLTAVHLVSPIWPFGVLCGNFSVARGLACAASRLAVWNFAVPSATALVAVYALLGAALVARRLTGISPGAKPARARWAVAGVLAALALAGLVAARARSPQPPDRFTATFL